jgi:heterodisulfide reductase subunit A
VAVTCELVVIPELVGLSDNAREIARHLRQPLDTEGFLQSANVRHRNVGSPRRGIYYAGYSRAESDLNSEIEEIAAALELPPADPDRASEPPAINTTNCIRCLTCVRACPHGAIVLRNHYQPEIVPTACYGCEYCVSNCPALAIETSPFPDTGPAQTVVFACERSAGLAAPDIDLPDETAVVSVPCACSVDNSRLLKTLAGGARRVVVAACHAGNCRSLKGAAYAASGTQTITETVGIPATRVSSINIAANESARLERMIKQAAKAGEDE